MKYILHIPIGNSSYMSAVVTEPAQRSHGAILVVKGIGWDAREEGEGRPSVFTGRLRHVDQHLVSLGNTVVALSHTSYDGKKLGGVTFPSYLRDIGQAVNCLEETFGQVGILGHSLGGYVAGRWALNSRQGNRIAMINTPLSLAEAIPLASRFYNASPGWIKPVQGRLGMEAMNAITKVRYFGNARAIPAEPRLLTECLAAPKLDDLAIGQSLGDNGLIMIGTNDRLVLKQPIEEYVKRCSAIANTVIALEGQGHELSTASLRQIAGIAHTIDDFFRAGVK